VLHQTAQRRNYLNMHAQKPETIDKASKGILTLIAFLLEQKNPDTY